MVIETHVFACIKYCIYMQKLTIVWYKRIYTQVLRLHLHAKQVFCIILQEYRMQPNAKAGFRMIVRVL